MISCPRKAISSLPRPQGCPAPGRAPPLGSPPPAWPDVLQLAPCPPAAPQASRGPERLTPAAGRCKIQFAADTSSRHPRPGQPVATAAKLRKWPQPRVCPAPLVPLPLPTPQWCRISQALGKKVSRNSELHRIVKTEAVFGTKQPGPGML